MICNSTAGKMSSCVICVRFISPCRKIKSQVSRCSKQMKPDFSRLEKKDKFLDIFAVKGNSSRRFPEPSYFTLLFFLVLLGLYWCFFVFFVFCMLYSWNSNLMFSCPPRSLSVQFLSETRYFTSCPFKAFTDVSPDVRWRNPARVRPAYLSDFVHMRGILDTCMHLQPYFLQLNTAMWRYKNTYQASLPPVSPDRETSI